MAQGVFVCLSGFAGEFSTFGGPVLGPSCQTPRLQVRLLGIDRDPAALAAAAERLAPFGSDRQSPASFFLSTADVSRVGLQPIHKDHVRRVFIDLSMWAILDPRPQAIKLKPASKVVQCGEFPCIRYTVHVFGRANEMRALQSLAGCVPVWN